MAQIYERLADPERELLGLMVTGGTVKQIATRLGVSVSTVKRQQKELRKTLRRLCGRRSWMTIPRRASKLAFPQGPGDRPPMYKFCKLADIDHTYRCRSITYVENQVCKPRDLLCKLAFFAKLPRRHGTPWHWARTDIGWPRSRAKNGRSRAQGMSS
jgi:hypothetical protein